MLLAKSKLITDAQNTFFSRSGYEINFDDDVWVLDKDITVNFDRLKAKLKDDQFLTTKKVLQYYVVSNSASHANNLYNRFVHYVDSVGSEVTSALLISYRASLNRENEWYLGALKGFLKKWHSLGYEGVSKEVVDLLDSWTFKGNIKGDVVKRLDPEEGPLTDIELLAFNESTLNNP